MKKKGGRPRKGEQRVRNQFKLVMPQEMFDRLTALKRHLNATSYSALVGDILLKNMLARNPPQEAPSQTFETLQVTISPELFKALEAACVGKNTNLTQAILGYLESELSQTT